MKASKSFFAPGKLYIAGEYAVASRKSGAILAPLSLGITSIIQENEKYTIRSQKYQKDFFFSIVSGKVIDLELAFISDAVQTAVTYLVELDKEITPFVLEISSTLDIDPKQKFGFGSSGAVSVAVIGAILTYFDVLFSLEDLFKLSVISQYKTNRYSSFGDVATSSFNAWIYYRAFSTRFLDEMLLLPISKCLKKKWKALKIKPIIAKEIPYLVIWSKEEANSARLVTEIQRFYEKNEFKHFAKKTKGSVARLRRCFTNQKNTCIIRHVQNLNQQLQNLAQFSGVLLYTQAMEEIEHIINKYEGTMKFSGAGGGDCVIAFFLSKDEAMAAKEELVHNNYVVLDNILKERE